MNDNDLRILCVELSRLLDPRESESIPAYLEDEGTTPSDRASKAGQAVEKAMRLVEEYLSDHKRIADAADRQAADMESVAFLMKMRGG